MVTSTDDLIDGTNFSIQFVLDKICGASDGKNGTKAAINCADLERIEAVNISDGSAFLSTILRVILHWKDGVGAHRNDLPNSIVMKVPGPQHKKLANNGAAENGDPMADPELAWLCRFLIGAHFREIRFYRHFAKLDAGFRLAKFYFGADYHPSHRDGLILMEDMTPRANTVPTLPGFTDGQVRALVAAIARIHAAAWLCPHTLVDIFPNGEDYGFEQRDLLIGMTQNAKKLKELEPTQLGALVDRVLPLFTSEHCCQSSYTGTKFGFPACIVHGDLYAPNILWERAESNCDGKMNGTAGQCQQRVTDRLSAIIDWQLVHTGNPCEDLCRLFCLNTSGQYRRQHTPALLEYYRAEVDKCMAERGQRAPFTQEQLNEAYREAMPFSMMFLCYGMPFYLEMDSMLGTDPAERGRNRQELIQRCRMFMEDTAQAAGLF